MPQARKKSANSERAPTAQLPQSLLPFTGFLLNKAAQNARETFDQLLAPLKFRSRHFGLLSVLNESGPITQQDAGALMRVDRSTMVLLVDELERLALVERCEHPTDRRAHALYLTAKGRKAREKAARIAGKMHAQFLKPLSAQEREILNDFLIRLL